MNVSACERTHWLLAALAAALMTPACTASEQAPAKAAETTIPATEEQALRTMQESTADATQDGSRNWDAELASAKTADEVIDLHRQRHGAESVKYD